MLHCAKSSFLRWWYCRDVQLTKSLKPKFSWPHPEDVGEFIFHDCVLPSQLVRGFFLHLSCLSHHKSACECWCVSSLYSFGHWLAFLVIIYLTVYFAKSACECWCVSSLYSFGHWFAFLVIIYLTVYSGLMFAYVLGGGPHEAYHHSRDPSASMVPAQVTSVPKHCAGGTSSLSHSVPLSLSLSLSVCVCVCICCICV